MKNPLPILAVLCALATPASAEVSTNLIPAVTPQILVEGRYAPSASGAVRLGFCGTVLHFRFHGSQLAMHVKATSDEVYFDVGLDGVEPVRLRCQAGDPCVNWRSAVAAWAWASERRPCRIAISARASDVMP